jgi:hypothetical protein
MNTQNPIKDEDEHVKEVYAYYGLAMYHAQCLERSLCILLAANTTNPRKMTRNDYDKILESFFKKTLGGLLKKLNEVVNIPNNFEDNLIKALDKRNWLAHNYFWERAGHFMTSKGRDFMIQELSETSNLFESIDNEISGIIDKWAKKLGITEEWLNQRMQEIADNIEFA